MATVRVVSTHLRHHACKHHAILAILTLPISDVYGQLGAVLPFSPQRTKPEQSLDFNQWERGGQSRAQLQNQSSADFQRVGNRPDAATVHCWIPVCPSGGIGSTLWPYQSAATALQTVKGMERGKLLTVSGLDSVMLC